MLIQRKAFFLEKKNNGFSQYSIHIDNVVLNQYNSIVDKEIRLSLPHIGSFLHLNQMREGFAGFIVIQDIFS